MSDHRTLPKVHHLPQALYRADQVRELDRLAIEEYGIPGGLLMERAGEAAWQLLEQRWPNASRILVLVGTGNNGGDGFVVARLALQAGRKVTVLQLGDRDRLSGDARSNALKYAALSGDWRAFEGRLPDNIDLPAAAACGHRSQGAFRSRAGDRRRPGHGRCSAAGRGSGAAHRGRAGEPGHQARARSAGFGLPARDHGPRHRGAVAAGSSAAQLYPYRHRPFRDDWVLTPHPGEAARLLDSCVAEIQADRFAAVEQLQRRYGGVAVLKGAGTLVASGGDRRPAVCSDGNPGMASGGMGDVLTGVVAGWLAQGQPLAAAAELAVTLHAAAADKAARAGRRGLLATDLMSHVRRLANPDNE